MLFNCKKLFIDFWGAIVTNFKTINRILWCNCKPSLSNNNNLIYSNFHKTFFYGE
jgi:hypothetical protein